MATLHSLPLLERVASDPLTPARHRLRQTIAAVDRVSRETEAAAQQQHRLIDVIGEHDRLQAQLHELMSRDQAARGEWIAAGRIGREPGRRRRHARAQRQNCWDAGRARGGKGDSHFFKLPP
jgi:hypothetical protein